MALCGCIRAYTSLRKLVRFQSVVAPASRNNFRGIRAQGNRIGLASKVARHQPPEEALSKYIADDYNTYNAEDWKGALDRMASDDCGASAVAAVVGLLKRHVEPQSLNISTATVEHILTKLIDEGLFLTCNDLLRLLSATALEDPKVVGLSVRVIANAASARAAMDAVHQLAAAGLDCRAVPLGYLFSLAENKLDVTLMSEIVRMVMDPPKHLRTLARQLVNPQLGVIDATNLPHLMRCHILEAYLHSYASQALQRTKVLAKTGTKASVPFRLVHSCTDVLVLLAGERMPRTTAERQQLQQFLANLDVPVYSFNPLDEFLGNQKPLIFDDVDISDEVRHQWQQYHKRFKYLYLFHLYEPTKGVRGNGRSEMLLIPGPAICAWMFGQPEFQKLLGIKSDPVVSAKDKLFASVPKSVVKRLAALRPAQSS